LYRKSNVIGKRKLEVSGKFSLYEELEASYRDYKGPKLKNREVFYNYKHEMLKLVSG